MASDPPAPRALPPGGPGPLSAVRHALLHTLPGRLLVVGAAVKLVTWLPRVAAGLNVAFIDAIGSIGSLAVIVALVYFISRLVVRAKRRLLWRVRRKLILSYIFVGVVPVLLVVAFFALGGLLLFLNVASYLVASSLRTMTDDALFVAQQTTAELAHVDLGRVSALQEIVARNGTILRRRYPNGSLAVVPTVAEPCGTTGGFLKPRRTTTGAEPGSGPLMTYGSWSHLAPPHELPNWVPCAGLAKLIAVARAGQSAGQPGSDAGTAQGESIGLVVRAAALPKADKPAFAVIVDVPLDAEMKSRIRDETSVKIGRVSPAAGTDLGQPLTVDAGQGGSALFKGLSDDTGKRRLSWLTLLDYTDWPSGATDKAVVFIEVNIADIYDRVSAEQAHLGGYTWGALLLGVLAFLAILFVIIEAVALLMGLILARSITGSVHQLFTGTERVRQGDFGHKIKITSNDQMGELAESFNSMTASIEDLLRQAEEKKRLEEELRIARAIQMSLLPRGQLVVPGLSITALCVPAREVGGDYYDLLPLADGRLGVLIADVAGKGTSAALYMAELKGLILSLSRIHTSPRQLLIEANRIIADNLDSRSFITVTYAVVDLQARTMTYARAGHTPLIHRTANGNGADVHVLAPDGLVVGLQLGDGGRLFERLLKEETVTMREGDLFMFFTDGITEAMNAASDCFGEPRLSEILAEHGDLPSEELRERILREIEAFVGGAPQHDDMTMILLKVEALGADRAQGDLALSHAVASRA